MIKNQNSNSRIKQQAVKNLTRLFLSNRDLGTLTASVLVRKRKNTKSEKSFVGLSIKTSSGRHIRLSGQETRTIYNLLRAAQGE